MESVFFFNTVPQSIVKAWTTVTFKCYAFRFNWTMLIKGIIDNGVQLM